jgi:hypothetical protein
MAPAVGFEPTTYRLTADCATAAPRRNNKEQVNRINPAHVFLYPARMHLDIFLTSVDVSARRLVF